jgi:hypothetical protein
VTLIDVLRLSGFVFGIIAGIRLGEHFGTVGEIVGGFLGAFIGVSAAQVLLFLIAWPFMRSIQKHRSPIPKIITPEKKEIEPNKKVKTHEVKPRWIIPIALGMFMIVGLIGTAIYRDFSILWNCFLLFLATIVIFVVGGLVLASAFIISDFLGRPSSWVLSKLANKIEGKKK